MLKTLDILIGATTVVLIFSMAVTVITQALTTIVGRRGKHLRDGLADLLQQLGIYDRDISNKIAQAVLTHPLFSEGKSWWGWGKTRLGTVISREDFTRILLDAASAVSPTVTAAVTTDPNAPAPGSVSPAPAGATPAASTPAAPNKAAGSDPLWNNLDKVAGDELVKMLKANGISDPGKTLKNVRDMALQLEASNPALASDVRQSLALIHEAKSDYVARVNSWFDQTIERVGERFTKYTHYVTVGIAAVVVLAVQLDIIAVIDRLSVDDSFRNTIVDSAIADFGEHSPAASTAGAAKKSDSKGGNSGTTQPAPATSNTPTPSGASAGSTVPGTSTSATSSTTAPAAPPATDGLTITQEATSSSSSTQPAPAASNGTPGGAVPATTVAGTAGGTPTTGTSTGPGGHATDIPKVDADKYYNDLSGAGLVTLPFGYNWRDQLSWRKVPGMLIAILLVSLGAPFWYNILKDLLGLRSDLAKNDDVQRATRQTTQDTQPAIAAITTQVAAVAPAWLKGERGDLGASG
jgi:hypothetical protein